MTGMRFASCLAGLWLVGVSAAAQDTRAWEQEARAAIDGYMRAFNARDVEGQRKACNFPLFALDPGGQVRLRAEKAGDLVTDFEALQKREGWDHSTLDLAETVHVSEDKVHFRIVFSRHHKDGATYRTVPGIWIATRQNGHWGLQLQSNMPDVPPSAR